MLTPKTLKYMGVSGYKADDMQEAMLFAYNEAKNAHNKFQDTGGLAQTRELDTLRGLYDHIQERKNVLNGVINDYAYFVSSLDDKEFKEAFTQAVESGEISDRWDPHFQLQYLTEARDNIIDVLDKIRKLELDLKFSKLVYK